MAVTMNTNIKLANGYSSPIQTAFSGYIEKKQLDRLVSAYYGTKNGPANPVVFAETLKTIADDLVFKLNQLAQNPALKSGTKYEANQFTHPPQITVRLEFKDFDGNLQSFDQVSINRTSPTNLSRVKVSDPYNTSITETEISYAPERNTSEMSARRLEPIQIVANFLDAAVSILREGISGHVSP